MLFKKLATVLSLTLLLTSLLVSHLSIAAPVWIDVRSASEHTEDNIKGDIRITHSQVISKVRQLFPDKNTEIKLYCRSGIRAEMALKALKKEGYANVSNAGGIQDARKQRSITQ